MTDVIARPRFRRQGGPKQVEEASMPTLRTLDLSFPMPGRLRLSDLIVGSLGDGTIRVVLGAARLWARLSRSDWHG